MWVGKQRRKRKRIGFVGWVSSTRLFSTKTIFACLVPALSFTSFVFVLADSRSCYACIRVSNKVPFSFNSFSGSDWDLFLLWLLLSMVIRFFVSLVSFVMLTPNLDTGLPFSQQGRHAEQHDKTMITVMMMATRTIRSDSNRGGQRQRRRRRRRQQDNNKQRRSSFLIFWFRNSK